MSDPFAARAEPGRFLLVDPSFAAAVEALGLPDPVAARALLDGAEGSLGRGATAILALPGHSARLHLRPVRHGGWLGALGGQRLLGLARPIAELRVTARLRAAGAPVPHPICVAGWRIGGPFWTALVGTLHEEDTRDGVAFLAGAPPPDRIRAAARAAGHSVRRFHDAGGAHADLHLKNLLLRERCAAGDATEALVIDLDRARAGAPPAPARRMRELMRLYRSLVKRDLLDLVGARGCVSFFEAYANRDRRLRAALLQRLPRERRRVAIHALGYRGRLS